jgi:hypothetical protein
LHVLVVVTVLVVVLQNYLENVIIFETNLKSRIMHTAAVALLSDGRQRMGLSAPSPY